MDDLLKKLTERRLTNSEIFSISKVLVPKSTKNLKDLAWVNIAKNLLKRITKQKDVNLAHNVYIFIEISVKAEVKSCMTTSAKLNRKLCPQISDLLSYIHCIADTDMYPSLSMSELDIGSLKATLLAAVIDLQVKGVPSGDENGLVTELYTKLTEMFGNSLETICDCLLLCRCLIYKNQRKPSVLIPLLRRVILCNSSKNVRFRCTSPMHYIKLLLLAKILLFMVETNEVLAVHSLVARALRVPHFFRDWLDQNDIPWLSQIDKNHLNVKNILRCMTVSTVLKNLYGTNKVICETLTDVKHETHIDAPQVKEEELEVKDLFIITKKKKKKESSIDGKKMDDQSSQNQSKKRLAQLEAHSSGAEEMRNKTNTENKKSSKPKKKEILGNSMTMTRIITPDSSKWSSQSDKQREGKVNGSPFDLQTELKRTLSKEEIINHRKRVRRDSLTFSVTNFIEENIAPVKEEQKGIWIQEKGINSEKISIGVQTDDCLLNESEFNVEICNAMTESSIKSVKIDKDWKVLTPKIDSPRSCEISKSKIELTKMNSSEEQESSKIVNVFLTGAPHKHNEKDNSPEVCKSDYSSSQNINKESDSDIEVIDEVLVLNSSSKSSKEVRLMKNDRVCVDDSEIIHHEIIQNIALKGTIEDVNTQIDNMFKGSELKENNSKEQEISKSIKTAEDDLTKATQNENVLDFATNRRYLKNGQELGRNIVLAKYQIEKMTISTEDVVNMQANKDYSILTKDNNDIAENEELEVLSTSGVKGDYGEERVSMGSCGTWSKNILPHWGETIFLQGDYREERGSLGSSVTCSKKTLPASPQQVANDNSNMHLKSSTQCLMSSQIEGKMVANIENTPGIPESQRIHKELIIGQSVSYNLNNQTQMKVNGTLPSSTTVGSQSQDCAKNISKGIGQDKKKTTDMNDSIKNNMNKTDKKNEKLKVGENYGRINYLVQASRKVFKNDESISSQLGTLAISFGRRLPQVRLDPSLKREMCKGCGVYLVYGVNAKVRHKSKRQKHLVITCLTCYTIKRFVTNPKYKLWTDQPQARV